MVAVASLSRILKQLTLPRSGLSDVTGIVADTIFKNTVRLRRMVTPGREVSLDEINKCECGSAHDVEHMWTMFKTYGHMCGW